MSRTLNRQELKEYLEVALGMETILYNQDEAIKQVRNKLNYVRSTACPTVPNQTGNKSLGLGKGLGLIGAGIVAFLILWNSMGSLWYLSIPIIIVSLVLFFSGIGKLLGIGKIVEENKRIQKSNQNSYDVYTANIQKYNAHQAMAKILNSRLEKMEEHRNICRNDLDKFYSKDILYPSYRNLIAVSSIYEYISSGRCDTLEGHEGAYNIFGVESRLDKIVTKMDTVIYHLNDIKANQYTLFNAVSQTKQDIGQLTSSIDNSRAELERMNNIGSATNAQLSKIACNIQLADYDLKQLKNEEALRNRALGFDRIF